MSAGEGSDYEGEDVDQDEVVLDNEVDGEDAADDGDDGHTGEKKGLRIQQKVGDHTCATYTFDGEDHTLGNLLRYSLIKNPEVEFCGYSITHPSEHTVNMRLQTTGKGTNEVLIQGLEAISFMADVTERKFRAELERKKSEDKARRKEAKKANVD